MIDVQELLDNLLPAFFDPLLDRLSDILPGPIYDALITVAGYAWALVSAFISLIGRIASSPQWDAETLLPPIITLLAAYLALVSFYRTTGWMIRSIFWFFKWGTILSTLAAGAGYFIGNANLNGENGVGGAFQGGGLMNAVGGLILDMINGQGQNAAGGQRTSRSRSRAQKQRAERPKAWESWDRHREWQYNENAANDVDPNAEVKKIVEDVIGAAARVVNEGGWWETAKHAFGAFSQDSDGRDGEDDIDDEQRQKQPSRKAKTKART